MKRKAQARHKAEETEQSVARINIAGEHPRQGELMKKIEQKQVFFVASSDNFGWDAVYAVPKRLVDRRALTGWTLIGVVKPGDKHPTPQIHGLFNVIGSDYAIAGMGRNFLGYCRRDENALKLYGNAARALLKTLARQSKSAKGAGKS